MNKLFCVNESKHKLPAQMYSTGNMYTSHARSEAESSFTHIDARALPAHWGETSKCNKPYLERFVRCAHKVSRVSKCNKRVIRGNKPFRKHDLKHLFYYLCEVL